MFLGLEANLYFVDLPLKITAWVLSLSGGAEVKYQLSARLLAALGERRTDEAI